MNRALIGFAVCLIAGTAHAGNGFSDDGYQYIELQRVGTMTGNYQTGHLLNHMTDGVEMTFVAKDEEANLFMRADTVDFGYDNDDDKTPSKILLTGSVLIRNRASVIESEHAVINLADGMAIFTGNPKMDSEQMRNLRATRIEVNLKTGDFQVDNGQVERMDLQLMESTDEAAEESATTSDLDGETP